MKNILQIPCHKIITGGQTGVDRAALDVCIKKGFPVGGWCPKNRRAEDGIIPACYPLLETINEDYKTRTLKNVVESDGTLIISTEKLSGGTLLTQKFCIENKKPVLVVLPEQFPLTHIITQSVLFIKTKQIGVLNLAGPRKSEWENGYHFSTQIVAGILNEIKTNSPKI